MTKERFRPRQTVMLTTRELIDIIEIVRETVVSHYDNIAVGGIFCLEIRTAAPQKVQDYRNSCY